MIEKIKMFYYPKFILNILKKPILGINKQFDYWLIVHFFAGVIIFKFIGAGKFMGFEKVWWVLGLLIAFELFELVLFKQSLAIPEKLFNTILDIVVGLIGYILAVRFLI